MPRGRRRRLDLERAEAAVDDVEERPRRRRLGVADDRDLVDAAMRELERAQPLGERRRIALEERRRAADRPLGGGPVAALPGERGEPEQDGRSHRPARGRRVVLDVLRPDDERSPSSAVSKKPPAGSAKRARITSTRPTAVVEPALVEGRLVQGEQALGQVGVVLEHAVGRGPAVLPRPPEPAVRPPEATWHGVGRRGRRLAVPGGNVGWPASPDAASDRAASANAAIASPFQAASTLSSRVGCGRYCATREQRGPRGREPALDVAERQAEPLASSASARTRDRIVRPSQLPAVGDPVRGREQRGVVRRGPRGPPPRTR